MKFLREPLLHFAVVGAILFGAYGWLNKDQPQAAGIEPVRIGEGEVQWLRQTFTNQWLRPPDSRELRGLVADLLNEELLAREAGAMGLGENDTIIRRRLAQKLKFLLEDTSRLAEPTDDELRQFYQGNTERFEVPAAVSFKHVFFNPQTHQDATRDATEALVTLRDADGRAAATIGDRFLLDTELTGVVEEAVSNTFGADFARAVFALQPGIWSGPLKSGYGIHLVFLASRTPAVRPALDKVRDQVVLEWRRQKHEVASLDYLARLREKYEVVLDDSAQGSLAPDLAANVAVQR